MKKEYSAGGVVFRKHTDTWDVLLIRDMNSVWTFPKGKIDPGEKPRDAAVREIAEETGIANLVYKKALTPIQYVFTRNGKVSKTVRFYVFFTHDKDPVPQHDEGISEAKFVRADKALDMLGYTDTQSDLYRQALSVL